MACYEINMPFDPDGAVSFNILLLKGTDGFEFDTKPNPFPLGRLSALSEWYNECRIFDMGNK